MNWFKEFQIIKRKQLELESMQTAYLKAINKHLYEISEMLEVGAIVKKRKGQTFRK